MTVRNAVNNGKKRFGKKNGTHQPMPRSTPPKKTCFERVSCFVWFWFFLGKRFSGFDFFFGVMDGPRSTKKKRAQEKRAASSFFREMGFFLTKRESGPFFFFSNLPFSGALDNAARAHPFFFCFFFCDFFFPAYL
jgi:hypothetical protein